MNARETALAVVRDVFPATAADGPSRGAQEALDYRVRRAELDGRDRAFATELAYGSIKMRRSLDWYLKPFVGERRETLPPAIAEVLRLSVYELLFTRADVHATVFEWVNLAKKYGHRGVANLVNAVLRNFLREQPPAPERASFDSDDDYLGTRYSLPTWIVRQFRETFGDAEVEAICSAVNDPAATALTVNTTRTTLDDVRERFSASQPSRYVPESLLVTDAALARTREEKAAGAWFVQSESSAMPVDILSPQPGESVLDVCSGRGNKALQIGARLAGEGSLLCLELDARKTATLQRRLDEAGVVAGIVTGDASAEVLQPGQRFDRVLIDAPCSGIGVIGRHAEARWKKQPGDGERLCATQRALLARQSAHVHPGGALVYATCSTDRRETTDVIEWFLSHHNFERGLIPSQYEPFLNASGDVVVPPGVEGRDGFYIARLERRT